MNQALRLMTWNMGGVPFLKLPPEERDARKDACRQVFERLTAEYKPDVIVLQEVVLYSEDGDQGNAKDRIVPPENYFYQAHMAIDTVRQNHPDKWDPIRSTKAGRWPEKAYLGQGNGFLWRKDMPHCSIWDYRRKTVNTNARLEAEAVRVDTGIFTGNRDTEPRLAVVAHFIHPETRRDIFIVNVHMTTLKGEREGFPERDDRGSKIRRQQVNIVLNGIVSRYNEWRDKNQRPATDQRPIWILAGDFNATEDSEEIAKIKRMNFMDLCQDVRSRGTKRSKNGEPGGITVDYIFAGPQYYSFDPFVVENRLKEFTFMDAPPPRGPIYGDHIDAVSDHYPVFAWFPMP